MFAAISGRSPTIHVALHPDRSKAFATFSERHRYAVEERERVEPRGDHGMRLIVVSCSVFETGTTCTEPRTFSNSPVPPVMAKS
jgi:hypothetical protein